MPARMSDPATKDLRLLQAEEGDAPDNEASEPELTDEDAPSIDDEAEADDVGTEQSQEPLDQTDTAAEGESIFESLAARTAEILEDPPATPLFDSAAHIMWAGVLATLAIMALIFVLLLRGRASRARADKAAKTDFFAPPADDFEAPPTLASDEYDDEAAAAEAIVLREEDIDVSPPKRGFFSGGDGMRQRADQTEPSTEPVFGATAKRARDASEPAADNALVGKRFAELEAGLEDRMDARLRRLEDRFDAGLRALSQTGSAEARAGGGEDLYGLLSGVEDALAAQSEGLKADTRNLLTDFAGEFDQRLATLGIGAAGGALGASALDAMGESSGVADRVDRTIADHEAALTREFDDLRARIDSLAHIGGGDLAREIAGLKASLKGSAGASTAPRVQLIDAIQRALPAGAYQTNADIDGRARADAIVRLAPQRPPIAVDAQFPIEAFDELDRVEATLEMEGRPDSRAVERAEQHFRRAALGHVVHVAEQLVRPPRTIDGAMLFLPSEEAYTEIQSRFPDVLHDAIRARVWIVSPASFSATLNIVRGLLQSGETAQGRQDSTQSSERIAAALDGLRRQVAALETRVAPGAASGYDAPGVAATARDVQARPTDRQFGAPGANDKSPAAPLRQTPPEPLSTRSTLASSSSRLGSDLASPATPTGSIDDPTAPAASSSAPSDPPKAIDPDPVEARREPRTFTEPYSSSLWSTQLRRSEDGDLNLHGAPPTSPEFGGAARRASTEKSPTQPPDERRFPLR
ncbi:MAG: DNA recombination protein RmuC [Pseudomonadota bacterium]